jgi:hypothetical protein
MVFKQTSQAIREGKERLRKGAKETALQIKPRTNRFRFYFFKNYLLYKTKGFFNYATK